ncbi:MAG: archaeosortase/exosortase family protein [Synechococcaceae cyanobacterium]
MAPGLRQRLRRRVRRRWQRLGRWLWQALLALVVTHNLTVIATTQFAPERLLSAVLAWGGALLCLEDQLPRLRPKPDWSGLLLGSLLLLSCLWRSARILVPDGLIYLLVPLQGLALAWLVLPRRQLARLWRPLLVLAALPASILLFEAVPEHALSLLTARLAQLQLLLLGLPALVDGATLLLAGGGAVRVAGGCSGSLQLVQVGLVTLILLLAFPLRRWQHWLLMLLLPPLFALVCNGWRVALLAWLNSLPKAQGMFWFQFLHEQAGALLIGGVAMTLTVLLHVALVERELKPLEAAFAAATASSLARTPAIGSQTRPKARTGTTTTTATTATATTTTATGMGWKPDADPEADPGSGFEDGPGSRGP